METTSFFVWKLEVYISIEEMMLIALIVGLMAWLIIRWRTDEVCDGKRRTTRLL